MPSYAPEMRQGGDSLLMRGLRLVSKQKELNENYINLPRLPPPPKPSLVTFPMSKNSCMLIFRFCPAPFPIVPIVLDVRVLTRAVWVLCRVVVRGGRVIVIPGFVECTEPS